MHEIYVDDQCCLNCRWFNQDLFTGKPRCHNTESPHYKLSFENGWCAEWDPAIEADADVTNDALDAWNTYEDEWN